MEAPTSSTFKPPVRAASFDDASLAKILEAFHQLDTDRTGSISAQDFKTSWIAAFGADMNVEEVLKEADVNVDGRIELKEWLAFVHRAKHSTAEGVELSARLDALGVSCKEGSAGTAAWRLHGPSSPVFAEYMARGELVGFGALVDAADKTIGPNDALIIVDMQNDFIPTDSHNAEGRLSSTEGGQIAEDIVHLAELFGERGGVVVATRDYHPVDHCSFLAQGGTCPPHCIQGNAGSHFYEPIAACMAKLILGGKRAEIVFKGFHPDVESFGSLTYPEVPPPDRGAEFACTNPCPPERLFGCTALSAWTGSFCMPCSNLEFEGKINVNAPPDVLAVYSKVPLGDRLRALNVNRVFVCGLVFDLCVTDTAINSVRNGFKDTYIVMDASRPCHVPGFGKIGSGFLNPLEPLQQRYAANGVKLCPLASLIPGFVPSNPFLSPGAVRQVFPMALGPFGFVPVKISLRLDFQNHTYVATPPSKEADILKSNGVKAEGSISPKHLLTLDEATLKQLAVPARATSYLWCNPIGSLGVMKDHARAWLPTTSAVAAFLCYGGFAYVDEKDQVVAAKALGAGDGLCFSKPQKWPKEYSIALQNRWSAVTVPFMVAKGAALFAWIHPGEVLDVDGKPWSLDIPYGAFAYLYHKDLTVEDERDQFFALTGGK